MSYDVSTLLAARNKLCKGLTLKPDLSPWERAIDKILMEERWKFIQAGQNRKDIKILGSKLLLKGRVHGSVVDSKFILNSWSNGSSVTQSKVTNTSANDSTIRT